MTMIIKCNVCLNVKMEKITNMIRSLYRYCDTKNDNYCNSIILDRYCTGKNCDKGSSTNYDMLIWPIFKTPTPVVFFSLFS